MKFTDKWAQSSVTQQFALVHECELYGCEHGDSPCVVETHANTKSRTINGHPARLLVRTITTGEWSEVK